MQRTSRERSDHQGAQGVGFGAEGGPGHGADVSSGRTRCRASDPIDTEKALTKLRNRRPSVFRSRLIGHGGYQMIETVPGTYGLGGHIAAVMGVDRASSGIRLAMSIPALVRPSSLAGLLVSSAMRVQFSIRSIRAAMP